MTQASRTNVPPQILDKIPIYNSLQITKINAVRFVFSEILKKLLPKGNIK